MMGLACPGQWLQVPAPGEEKEWMGQLHCRHEPAGQKAPSVQLLHDVALSAAENVPAAHGSHCTAFDLEKLPALHGSGAAMPGCGQ
jgi:hypothetical protein